MIISDIYRYNVEFVRYDRSNDQVCCIIGFGIGVGVLYDEEIKLLIKFASFVFYVFEFVRHITRAKNCK